MSIVTTSKVLISRPEFTTPLIAEAKRVAELGGAFTMQNNYTGAWYLEVTIIYPEGVNAAKLKELNHD